MDKYSCAIPFFGMDEENRGLAKQELPNDAMEPRLAKRMVEDFLLDEGNARMNLATFCQTYMEEEAIALMAGTLEKNAIDKSEYPKTAKLEQYCIEMLANLWSLPKGNEFIGTSTVGSSEACMLAGMALKFRWRTYAKEAGIDINVQKPNLIISSGMQVCWEKFCVYWDIEMREIPISKDEMYLNIDKTIAAIDDYTIGVVGILGITYTGKYDDIRGLDLALNEYNKERFYKVPIHVDGASGAMFAPFVHPNLKWDFQLENVISISTSGHKYGLVYPGVGWVVWKEKEYLPKELVFEVSYLGGELPTIAINFSRSASQIVGQYYAFVRYGKIGYQRIQEHSRQMALYISQSLKEIGEFEIINDGDNLPIVCYTLSERTNRGWTLYDLSDRLLMRGWQIPSYPLPANLEEVIIQRIVCRADLGMDMAEQLVVDIKDALHALEEKIKGTEVKPVRHGFTH